VVGGGWCAVSYQIVNRCRPESIDEVDDQLEDEDGN